MRISRKWFFVIAAVVGVSAARLRAPYPATPLSISYPAYFGNRFSIPADNPVTQQGVYLGRMLFYETALSAGNTLSCASCHRQALAFTDGEPFSRGADSTLQPRNTMSLANLLWTKRFFWDGRVSGLEKQAETPLTRPHEMGQSLDTSVLKLHKKGFYGSRFLEAFGSDTITADRIMKALAQFERTLVSADSRYDRYLQGQYVPTASELSGMQLFFTAPDPARRIRGAACAHCHGGPKTYSELFHNNGLDSISSDAGMEMVSGQLTDRGRFKAVSLRNVALTAPYMHDGRFKTLEEVVTHYNGLTPRPFLSPFLQNRSNTAKRTSLNLTAKEQGDLAAFLRLLTDSTFIKDPRFSNPFTPAHL